MSKNRQKMIEDNEEYIQKCLDEQRAIINKQNADLEIVSAGLDRLKVLAGQIGTELDYQNKELNKLQYNVEKTTAKLKRTTKQMENIQKPLPIFSYLLWPISKILG